MLRHPCTCTVMRTRESEISLVELTSILSQEVKIGNLPDVDFLKLAYLLGCISYPVCSWYWPIPDDIRLYGKITEITYARRIYISPIKNKNTKL